MKIQHSPGHLARGGWLNHHVMREHVCACGTKFTGPPISKRCRACHRKKKNSGRLDAKLLIFAKRNVAILESRAAGATYPELSKQFGLSETSIGKIVRKAKA